MKMHVSWLLKVMKEAREFIDEYPPWAQVPPKTGHFDLLEKLDAAIDTAEQSLQKLDAAIKAEGRS